MRKNANINIEEPYDIDNNVETAEELLLRKKYRPADLMVWVNDSKRDHIEHQPSNPDAACETAEVLLQRGLNYKTLTPQEEYDLFSAYKSETDPLKKEILRNEFLHRNLRLVMHLAKQQSQRCDYAPKDLIAWGTLGMIRAFEKFELTKGAKFSTYAAKWIQQAMTRGLAETQRSIRVPYNILTDLGKMKKFQQQFLNRTGEEATDEDICAKFGWSQEKLEYIRKGLTPISSIDVPTTDGEDTVGDLIEDEDATPVDEEVCSNIRRQKVDELLKDTLDERALDIVRNLYGFEVGSLDKDALAEKYGITRERVLQIRDEAISLLRHPSKSRKLRGFLIG